MWASYIKRGSKGKWAAARLSSAAVLPHRSLLDPLARRRPRYYTVTCFTLHSSVSDERVVARFSPSFSTCPVVDSDCLHFRYLQTGYRLSSGPPGESGESVHGLVHLTHTRPATCSSLRRSFSSNVAQRNTDLTSVRIDSQNK
ncbi:hypothetical protein J6590_009985 [Homalodisca vitripennis]|nr:hypothetical protein J6590_009985 [Homalodisca vitripennis]